MVIVTLTRSDLRDEFDMADDVFALSPISASPALPGEADYEAIRDAFMETSRGRWFLGEYAKRNRNSDTGMVLDAVARIEHAMATQRQSQQSDDNALPEALAKIRAAIDDATRSATEAVEELRIEKKLTPVRIGARIIKEISWRWREIGTDSRICDLIDSQVSAIDAACDQLTDIDPQLALAAAFDIINTQLDALSGPATPATADADSAPSEAAATTADIAAAPDNRSSRADRKAPENAKAQAEPPLPDAVATIEPVEANEPVATAASAKMMPEPEQETADIAESAAEVVPDLAALEAELSAAAVEVQQTQQVMETQEIQEAQEAQDEAEDDALLELVAMEMAAEDSIDDEELELAGAIDSPVEKPIALDDDVIAAAMSESDLPEPEIAAPPIAPTPSGSSPRFSMPAAPAATPSPLPVAQEPPAAAPTLQIVPKKSPYDGSLHEGSLGSSLLANGLVQRPRMAANDPLTPIRRMSQPEKIAFFS